jgi:hypothetical protein
MKTFYTASYTHRLTLTLPKIENRGENGIIKREPLEAIKGYVSTR